ncbi:uncharacterized protein LOC115309576 [Ixodes scapularis]|uniref:uncharacterized protein LOC115309576 n=1 Tax=Ixodes scapularis TaxID=6945 RepID=UPI001C38304F|nr:uncharacterized protein LOC115309576 [Ixodes scapularis]XP_040066840.2 uncharacterized protein LOC115309576 [Ixodes scapularis]XP_042148584.1 uncharacterized protein LOC115309576 [Ixodes scapularis]
MSAPVVRTWFLCCHIIFGGGAVVISNACAPRVPVQDGSSVTFLWLFGCLLITEGSRRLIMGDTVLCSHLHGVRQSGEASQRQPFSISVPGALCSFSLHLTVMSGSKER